MTVSKYKFIFPKQFLWCVIWNIYKSPSTQVIFLIGEKVFLHAMCLVSNILLWFEWGLFLPINIGMWLPLWWCWELGLFWGICAFLWRRVGYCKTYCPLYFVSSIHIHLAFCSLLLGGAQCCFLYLGVSRTISQNKFLSI